MKLPGFKAEASLYKSKGCYLMGEPDGIARQVVTPAIYYGEYMQSLDDMSWSRFGTGGIVTRGASYWFCRAKCIRENCFGGTTEKNVRCIDNCETLCRLLSGPI